MAAIQIVRFRLNAGVERREATRAADGEWILVLRYADLESAKKAGRSDTSDVSKKFMAMIDMKTLAAGFSEVVSQ
jgi:hypothetical protein